MNVWKFTSYAISVPSLPTRRVKKVEFSERTKKAMALKNANKKMMAKSIEVDMCDVSKISKK